MEIHHIQPREFGGNNDLGNLMPVPVLQHSAISGWFRGYYDPTESSNADPIEK